MNKNLIIAISVIAALLLVVVSISHFVFYKNTQEQIALINENIRTVDIALGATALGATTKIRLMRNATITSDVYPELGDTYDLGTLELRWADVNTEGLNVGTTTPWDGYGFTVGTSAVFGGAGDIKLGSGSNDILAYSTITSNDIVPAADSTYDLGTQTTAQWANVWADLVNGSDYSYLNGWRMLEADKYQGYSKGIAFGNSYFIQGQITDQMLLDAKPIFVITEDFIEFQGRRLTPEFIDFLISFYNNSK